MSLIELNYERFLSLLEKHFYVTSIGVTNKFISKTNKKYSIIGYMLDLTYTHQSLAGLYQRPIHAVHLVVETARITQVMAGAIPAP